MSARVAMLLCLGLLAMAADLLQLPLVRGAAAATVASPAPKVFTRVGELEPYSMRFSLEYVDGAGVEQRVAVTPERYARLRGPYNRRNAYGAALAAGPYLRDEPMTRAMFEQTARHALCGQAPLLAELGVDPASVASGVRIVYTARGRGLRTPPALEVECP